MTALLTAVTNALIAAGLLVTAAAFARRAGATVAIAAGLELWIAAGLLRLAALHDSWMAIGTAALIVALRRLLTSGLRFGAWAYMRSAK